jgi:hypothetical protein
MYRLYATLTTLLIGTAAYAGENAANYAPGQERVGEQPTFHTSGPATENANNYNKDGLLDAVEYSNGQKHIFFYKPVNVFDLQYTGDPSVFRVGGASGVTVGSSSFLEWGDTDVDTFGQEMIRVLSNNNLANYVDLAAYGLEFSFILEFDMVVRDNDPGPDDFGELLYFERGMVNGNSWITLQAVDSSGVGLGPALLISPKETIRTTPQTFILSSDQHMGGAAIDVSRLGVTEFKYLRVSTTDPNDPQYAWGGDRAPDFKLMAVITDPTQMLAVTSD